MIVSPTRYCTDNAINLLIRKYCHLQNVAILDVGCGKGQYYQYFTSRAIKGSYLGIDVKGHEAWQTKEEQGLQISYLVHDAEELQNLNRKFDFIIAIQSFEHIKHDGKALRGVRTLLKTEGHLMLTVPSKYSFFLYGFHGYRRYSIPKLKRLAKESGLYVIEIMKLGGLTSFLLHFILWTIPAILLRVPIWQIYKKSLFLNNSIAKLERFFVVIDEQFRFLEAGYAVILEKGGD